MLIKSLPVPFVLIDPLRWNFHVRITSLALLHGNLTIQSLLEIYILVINSMMMMMMIMITIIIIVLLLAFFGRIIKLLSKCYYYSQVRIGVICYLKKKKELVIV